MQDLETLLDSAVVRTGSSVAVAENTGAARSVPAHLAQFAEAQRIIVLDAIRTDLLQPDAASESSHRTNGAMNGEAASLKDTPTNFRKKTVLPMLLKNNVPCRAFSTHAEHCWAGELSMRLGSVTQAPEGI